MPASGASARRYAQAVFEIAVERSTLDAWKDDLDAISEAATNAAFVAMLESPRLPATEKRSRLSEVLTGVSEEAVNLATVLVVKGRLQALTPGIVEAYGQLLDEHRGIVRVEVITAVEISADQRGQIAQQMGEATQREVRLEHRVDPAIGGGMVIRISDRVLDGSIRAKLGTLRKSLIERSV
jgi:F-type H+-transporting ATPase subunit delta